MSFVVGKRSYKNLIGVYPLLAACVVIVITRKLQVCDAGVFEGVRTLEKQRNYFNKGVSKTMKSWHLPGLAIDIVPYIDGAYRWNGRRANGTFDQELQDKVDKSFAEINKAMKEVAEELGIKIENLHDKAGWDKPHWTLRDVRYDFRLL